MKNKKHVLGVAFISSVFLAAVGLVAFKTTPSLIRTNALGGSGTSDDPYLIASASDMEEVMSNVNTAANDYSGKYLSITADLSIELSATSQSKTFRGHLDGGNHTLTLSTSATGTYVAMFNCVGGAGSVSNITFAGSLSGVGESSSTVCAFNYGRIENIINNCSISSAASNSYVGGIAGSEINASAVITNCVNNATISGSKYVGGIVGNLRVGTISNTINKGNVTASSSSVAGIAGLIGRSNTETFNAVITDCINEGNISGAGQVAGIAGGVYPQLTCNNCSNYGNITTSANSGAGGIAGLINSNMDSATFSFTNCYSSGTVTTSAGWAGGLFGYAGSASLGTVTFNNVLSAARLVCTNSTGNLGGFMAGQNSDKMTFNLIKCQSMASVSCSATSNVSNGIGIAATTIETNEDSTLEKNDGYKGVELSSTTIAMLRAIREFDCTYSASAETIMSDGVDALTADEITVLSSTIHYGASSYQNDYYTSALYIDNYLSTHNSGARGITNLFNNNNIKIIIPVAIVLAGALSLVGIIFIRKRKMEK